MGAKGPSPAARVGVRAQEQKTDRETRSAEKLQVSAAPRAALAAGACRSYGAQDVYGSARGVSWHWPLVRPKSWAPSIWSKGLGFGGLPFFLAPASALELICGVAMRSAGSACDPRRQLRR